MFQHFEPIAELIKEDEDEGDDRRKCENHKISASTSITALSSGSSNARTASKSIKNMSGAKVAMALQSSDEPDDENMQEDNNNNNNNETDQRSHKRKRAELKGKKSTTSTASTASATTTGAMPKAGFTDNHNMFNWECILQAVQMQANQLVQKNSKRILVSFPTAVLL